MSKLTTIVADRKNNILSSEPRPRKERRRRRENERETEREHAARTRREQAIYARVWERSYSGGDAR